MLIDIVILPPQNIRKRIGGKIKREINDYPNYFIVDNNKLIPHLSLWHLKISKEKLITITEKLRQIIKGQKQIKISSSGFHALEKYKGCIEYKVKKNKDLAYLQRKVFKNIYPYKSGAMPEFAPFLGISCSAFDLQEINNYVRHLGIVTHFTMGLL
ncbi:MAG: hypothetical protein V1907_00705, partial [Candidatus Kerfeldbacteria bacterium]